PSHARDLHSFPTRRSSDLENIAEVRVRFGEILLGANSLLVVGDSLLPSAELVIGMCHIVHAICRLRVVWAKLRLLVSQYFFAKLDRKSTRLNSSHRTISYA